MAHERNYADECGDHGGNRGECGLPAGWGTDFNDGKCKHHRGTSPDGGSHDGNDFAVTHGVWRDSFVQNHLTDKEIERVKQGEELLGEPESAQSVGKTAAMLSLEQYRRTGDERFLRRYESICDTFNIAPDDEMNLNVDADVTNRVEGVTAEFVVIGDDESDE